MRKEVIAVLLCVSVLHAGVFDFVTLKQAKEAYAKGEYEKAARLYEKVAGEGSDEAKFNAGDALYKAGDYAGALKMYEKVSSKKLEFEKLHNMGNCYARLKKIDKGIEAYEKALKIKEDKETRFNLELLKRLKQNQKNQKRNQKQKSQSQNSKKSQNSSSKNGAKEQKKSQNEPQKKEGRKNRQSEEKKDQKQGEDQTSQAGQKNQKEKQQKENGNRKQNQKRSAAMKKREMQGQQAKPEPISDMELRKWNKELNRRGIHTLMLPLPTKKREGGEHETGEW